jgi:hypothetical protein
MINMTKARTRCLNADKRVASDAQSQGAKKAPRNRHFMNGVGQMTTFDDTFYDSLK